MRFFSSQPQPWCKQTHTHKHKHTHTHTHIHTHLQLTHVSTGTTGRYNRLSTWAVIQSIHILSSVPGSVPLAPVIHKGCEFNSLEQSERYTHYTHSHVSSEQRLINFTFVTAAMMKRAVRERTAFHRGPVRLWVSVSAVDLWFSPPDEHMWLRVVLKAVCPRIGARRPATQVHRMWTNTSQ